MTSIYNYFRNCQLCPRSCAIDRTNAITQKLGFCGETDQLRVAAIEAHFGEEPPISGSRGSGTIFFTGCSLKCVYCQNYQISHDKMGTVMSVAQVVDCVERLIKDQQIHNINFVTPDHFFPYCVAIVEELRKRQFRIPAVFNLSGYQSVNSLRMIADAADIYLPDFKYSDPELAAQLSHCRDYPTVALEAIAEMVRQKGFLDCFDDNHSDTEAIASRGVLVRHLILPGQLNNSIEALTMLFVEFGAVMPLSLMSQYYPVRRYHLPFLNRTINADEFQQVYDHVSELGFRYVFVQFPDDRTIAHPFVPDFRLMHPFVGNVMSKN